ncbi:MAG: efflux RND transporter periplasmic adaptor subunit [Bacteroidales bacterium]|nr:efflux RND transporter periplasmic adaptor subunit [Bacteroidales bacterium]
MKETNKSLLAGLAVVIVAVIVVALVGLLATHPRPEQITGEVDASEYRVSNKVPGRIDSLFVSEGDMVHRGDTLAHINSPQVDAKMLQATAVQNAANAQSDKARHGARNQQVQMAYQVWQKALAAVDVYQKSFNRIKGLYEKGVVSAQKYDEVEAKYKVAQADAMAAEQQYLMAKEGAQKEDIAAASALADQAGGAVAEVQSYLDDSWLIAPCNGEVVEVYAKMGDLIGTGSPVLSILDMNDAWFTFAVREDLLQGLQTGSKVQIAVPALGTATHSATIKKVQAMASYATWRSTKTNGQYDVKSFDIKVVADERIEGLRPGMTAIIAQ